MSHNRLVIPWAENSEAVEREPKEFECLVGEIQQVVPLPAQHQSIPRDSCVSDEGACCGGNIRKLVEHCLGVFEGEEDLVKPCLPNFDVHLATGAKESKSVKHRGNVFATCGILPQVSRVEGKK